MADASDPCEFRYIPAFLAPPCADELLDALLRSVEWRSEQILMFGRRVTVPRLVAWCGDEGVNYRYSGLDHPCGGWLRQLVPVRERLAGEHRFSTQLALLNRYRDGADSMGWHADDERGQGAWIASLSLGAPRRFLLRAHPDRPALRLVLEHGSLLFMRGAIPHALPRTRRPAGERINLSFRQWAPVTHG